MCQINAKFTLAQMGDISQVKQSLEAMETVNDVNISDNVLSLSFNHHKYTERELARDIETHGFKVQSVE
jgi:hypothetical protein